MTWAARSGCAGTIARQPLSHDSVYWLNLGQGERTRGIIAVRVRSKTRSVSATMTLEHLALTVARSLIQAVIKILVHHAARFVLRRLRRVKRRKVNRPQPQ